MAIDKKIVSVVGLGYVGLSIAAVLARKGLRVMGVDCREEVVASINAGKSPIREPGMDDLLCEAVASGRLTAHVGAGVVGGADFIILAVGTPLDDNYSPETGQLTRAADDIAPFLKKGQAVILKSTVPPGTTRELAGYLAARTGLEPGSDLIMASCPERLAEGRIIRDLEAIPVIVGGITPGNTGEVASFWSGAGWEVIKVSGPEEAEMIKLADNLWIDQNIALANELCILCRRLNIDVLEVINAANTLPKGMGKVNILFPGPGVGGSCLVKDPWFLHYLGRKNGVPLKLPRTGREINEGMPGFIEEIIREELGKKGVALEDSNIAVLGLSFKENTGDTRFSPSVPLIKKISAAGARICVCDPWVDPAHANDLLKGMAAVEEDITAAVRGSQAVIFMVGHPEFRRPASYWSNLLIRGCLVIDGRYIFEPAEMREAGLDYIAPGRRAAPELNWGNRLCREF